MTNNYNNLLFLSLLKKYKKYFSQLDKKIKNGTFAKMAAYQRQSLVKKVEQLRAKLNGFQLNTLKYGAAAAFLLTVGTASAQGPFVLNEVDQIFPVSSGRTDVVTWESDPEHGYELPAFVDLDNDGDLDVVGGNYNTFVYFRNEGTVSAPNFVQRTGTSNPFNGLTVNGYAAPTLADFDGDGKEDMVAGDDDGVLHYYKNTGTTSAPAFTELMGTNSPLFGIDLGEEVVPFAVNIDNDADIDIVVGSQDVGDIFFLQNTGSATAPAFVNQTLGSPFASVNPVVDYRAAPTFVDIDNDGDKDLFVGDYYRGIVRFFRNNGSASAASFVQVTGSDNPVSAFKAGRYNYEFPAFADIDNDGDVDLFIGGEGKVQYYENTGNATAANFNIVNDLAVETGGRASSLAVDIDNDGDKDVFVGARLGEVLYFENTGSASYPALIQRTGTANPLNIVDAGIWSTLAAADLDADGDKDIVVAGVDNGALYYCQNVGTISAPSFPIMAPPSASNFPMIGTTSNVVELADIDNDGDADLLIGSYTSLEFYLNTGSASAYAFTLVSGTLSPFDGMVGTKKELSPDLVDLDGDLDLDLALADNTGGIRYFENTGTLSLPVFTEAAVNPFSVVAQSGSKVRPEFWDYDNDGDGDLFLGMAAGNIMLYENDEVVTTSVLTPGSYLKATAVEVFPNPTAGSFTINVPAELSGAALITISDLSGRQLFSERRELQSGDLSYAQVLSDKQPGTYVLKIVMDNRVGVAKIVKQ